MPLLSMGVTLDMNVLASRFDNILDRYVARYKCALVTAGSRRRVVLVN